MKHSRYPEVIYGNYAVAPGPKTDVCVGASDLKFHRKQLLRGPGSSLCGCNVIERLDLGLGLGLVCRNGCRSRYVAAIMLIES